MCFGRNNHCNFGVFGWDRWLHWWNRGHAFDLNVFVVVVCVSKEYFFLFKEAIKQVLRYCSFQVVTPYHPKHVLNVGIFGIVGRCPHNITRGEKEMFLGVAFLVFFRRFHQLHGFLHGGVHVIVGDVPKGSPAGVVLCLD